MPSFSLCYTINKLIKCLQQQNLTIMDLETVSHNCRTCGKDSSVGKDVFTNSAIRTWLDKTLNISLEKNDGKSNFVCSVCSQKIRQWILFRANYQKVRKNFELLAEQQLNGEDGKNLAKELKGKASRQQKRLDDWLKPKTSASGEVKTEVDEDGDAITKHQKMAPMRVKIEPKIEADLHDTYGYTGINHISPVKEELKEEVVEDECVDLDEDDDAEEREAERKKAIATKKRVESIRRKFQKIGERERKNKLIKTQKQALDEARKKTRDVLPTKTARKAPQKPKPISKKNAANVSDVSEDETEKENQTDETLPPRVTRKKVVNYAGDKGESEDSDPDDPEEVDYYPENDEKSATEDNAAEKDSDSEEEAAEKSDKEEHKETEVQEPVPIETENVPESPKLPAPDVPKQAARRSRPMPLSKKNPVQEEAETQSQPKKSDVAEKEVQASSQKRKLDATEKDDVSEAAPAKKKCLPLSIKKKLEEAERRKKMEAAVTISSGSDSSDSESSSPTTKKKSLLDYFSVKASGNK